MHLPLLCASCTLLSANRYSLNKETPSKLSGNPCAIYKNSSKYNLTGRSWKTLNDTSIGAPIYYSPYCSSTLHAPNTVKRTKVSKKENSLEASLEYKMKCNYGNNYCHSTELQTEPGLHFLMTYFFIVDLFLFFIKLWFLCCI